MGLGYTYKCKCPSLEPILLGVGMGYPILREETWRDMSTNILPEIRWD